MSLKTIAVVSGGFDPVHTGHITLIYGAAQYGQVFVGLNSDDWLARKKGRPFMPFNERMNVLLSLKHVLAVRSFDDSDGSAKNLLQTMLEEYPEYNIVFCNGGDRRPDNIPEMEIQHPRLIFRFGVGGDYKTASSSDFLKNWREPVWVKRPWGRWAVVDQGPRFKVKRLEILPDQSISLQYHTKRGEHWTVVHGSALTAINGKVQTYNVGESFHVPLGKLHRVYNNSSGLLICTEVQYGECVEEDIVRV
jgi:D-beta-D-heptose 7-phosphate kinase/D-beta-D-heptose 1-phosphate adenosyltransferase